jgi:hypothetical protein
VHHDAQVPSEYLPGRHRDARPGVAREIRWPARARRQFHVLFVADEVRSIMAELGIRRFEQPIGRSDLLDTASASITGRRAA